MPRIEAQWLRTGAPRTVLRLRHGAREVVYTDHGERYTLTERATGRSLVAVPGLTVSTSDLERVIAFEIGEDGSRSASVVLTPSYDVALDVEAGRSVTGAWAELSQVWSGMEWEDRRILLRGVASAPVWGGLGEPLEFTITTDPDAGARSWPPSTWYVTDSTWPRDDAHRPSAYIGANPGRDSNTDGAIYPLIIGYPGSYVRLSQLSGALITTQVPAVPALYVEGSDSAGNLTDHAVLCAGGVCAATQLTIINVTAGDQWTDPTPGRQQDQLGQTVTAATPYSLTGTSDVPSEGDDLYSTWPITDGGGLPNPYGTGCLRRADHVLRWCLEQSGLRVDHSKLANLSALSGIGIDTYIDAAVDDLWTWAKANLLPLLPARAAEGPEGHYAYALDVWATEAQAVARLEEGRNAERTSRVTAGPIAEVVNRFSISFAPNLYSDLNCSTITITGRQSAEEEADANILTDYVCARSQAVAEIGVRDGGVIEAPVFYEHASAIQALRAMAQLRAVPPLRLSYALGPELGWLAPGDVVAVTSTRLHWTDRVAHVEAVAPLGAGVEVQLVVIGIHALQGAGA